MESPPYRRIGLASGSARSRRPPCGPRLVASREQPSFSPLRREGDRVLAPEEVTARPRHRIAAFLHWSQWPRTSSGSTWISGRLRELSSGNRRKVALLLAFLAGAELLILDEPTSGLDPLMQRELLALVREAQERGTTVFLSSHVLSEVQRAAAGR